jgi:hypothetical protein
MRTLFLIFAFWICATAASQTKDPVVFKIERYKIDEGYHTLADIFKASELTLQKQKTDPGNLDDLLKLPLSFYIVYFVHKGLSKNQFGNYTTPKYITENWKALPPGTKIYFENIEVNGKEGRKYKIKSLLTTR